jgi:hypothetical protein
MWLAQASLNNIEYKKSWWCTMMIAAAIVLKVTKSVKKGFTYGNSHIKSYQSYLKIECKKTIEKLFFRYWPFAFISAWKQNWGFAYWDWRGNSAFIYAVSSEVNPRSQARIISGLKSFFGYLILKILDSTTLELIESPKTGRKLPDTYLLMKLIR